MRSCLSFDIYLRRNVELSLMEVFYDEMASVKLKDKQIFD